MFDKIIDMGKIALALGALCLCPSSAFAAEIDPSDLDFPRPDPNVAEFSRGVKFTVSGYAGETELANFPVLVRLSANFPAGFSYSDFFSASGDDLCFLDAEGNGIPYEIDTWNPAGESLVWVTLPTLSGNDTTFSMWYRSSKSGKVVSSGDAWSDYVGVWHMGETGDGVQTIYDSTVNDLTGVTHKNSSYLASGAVGAARRVSNKTGSSPANGQIIVDLSDPAKKAAVDTLAADDGDKTFTVSFWHVPYGNVAWAYLVNRRTTDYCPAWGLQFENDNMDGKIRVFTGTGDIDNKKENRTICDTVGLKNGVWNKLDVVYANTSYSVYVNGQLKTSANFASRNVPVLNGSVDLAFGGCIEGSGSFNLKIAVEIKGGRLAPEAERVLALCAV